MKRTLLFFIISFSSHIALSQDLSAENVIIVTTDGFRWQEIFNGADSSLLFNSRYVMDTGIMRSLFWAGTAEERRKKLMPFLWNYVSGHGQLWGNRNLGNEVTVDNPYRLSFAGYSELLTGYTDMSIKTNKPKKNSHDNLLSFIVRQPGFRDSVALFASWKVMEQVVHNPDGKLILNAGYKPFDPYYVSLPVELSNRMQVQSEYRNMGTRSDMLTFTTAMEYMRVRKPRVLYISLGETDEFAHHGKYDLYLLQAALFDKMLADIWMQVQHSEVYRGKTLLFVTTDHGRGARSLQWTKHGILVGGSDQTWMVQMGPGVEPLGEMPAGQSVQVIQFAQYIAHVLGLQFETSGHPVAESFIPDRYKDMRATEKEQPTGGMTVTR